MMATRSLAKLLIGMGLGILAHIQPAWAYPEMVRYNYVNCTACHVAPTGGGALTAYGRQTSKDVLSTWSAEGEEKPAYFIDQPEWLNLGGDYRSAYIYENTPRIEMGTYQFMQLDVEAAATYKKFTFDATVGYQDDGTQVHNINYLVSRKHYVMYHPTDEIAIRAGRFFPEYGIYTPNHSLLIRDTLNMFQPEALGDGESYNLEFSYIGDTYNVFVTGIFGRPDDPNFQRYEGVSAVASRSFADHYKAGLSYTYGTDANQYRNAFGPWGILGFTQKLYLLTEMDFQGLTPKTAPGYNPIQWGYAETSRLGYELVQGLNLVVDEEIGRTNFSSINSLQQRYGAGIWWYPRPHLEASFEYQKRQNLGLAYADFYDYMYFLWHIYI